MKSLAIGGVALAALIAPVAAHAHGAPQAIRSQIVRHSGMPMMARGWGPHFNGRWVAGWRAPGGWAAYRHPVRGYVLPGYWINPGFYIGNYAVYGLAAPARGHGWSRYYDDAVLTDRDGRVVDAVPAFAWDRYDTGLADEPSAHAGHGTAAPTTNRIDDAAAAAAAAAADGKPVEAPHAHAMQGHGDGHALTYDYRDADRGDVTYRGRWTGTWTGHYEGQPTTVYHGTYEGRHDGSAPHWAMRDGPSHMEYHDGPSYGYGYGYGWGAPMMTTITFQSAPVFITTTTTTEEIVYGAASPKKRPARRIWKPRPKQRCTC